EGGCRLKVDIAKAFFSPRLSTEHLRVAQQVKPRECVVDMFAGVGPFSVLIAKRVESVRIHAIDHNPDATRLAEENARLNKVADKITVWTGDARIVSKKNLSGVASRVIMNHPSRAREFLKPACETLGRSRGLLHYYTFADGPDSESKAERELKAGLVLLDRKISILSTRKVRGVAPMKWQIVVDAELALS
ncbi:MAG TPA: methyltransferase, partial [Candidatus Bathyarchaeia archaeon]|nr:methyltransferase [Candidatus Bathyarchaeia archaeon]